MSDISERYTDLAAKFTALVDAVPENRWSSQTPCDEWTARELVGHMVGNCGLFLGFIEREVPPGPSVDDDPRGAWANGRDALQAALDDPAASTKEFDGFMGRTSLEQAVSRFMFIDLVVHSWDLARATGLDEHLDPADVHWAFETVEPMDDMLRSPGVCGPKVEAPAGADEQTRFLSFLGRQV